jgi:hypothetical protein
MTVNVADIGPRFKYVPGSMVAKRDCINGRKTQLHYWSQDATVMVAKRDCDGCKARLDQWSQSATGSESQSATISVLESRLGLNSKRHKSLW